MAEETQSIIAKLREVFVKSYPDSIADVTETHIVWKDGSKTPLHEPDVSRKVGEEFTFQEKLDNPTLFDQVCVPYQVGPNYRMSRGLESGRWRYVPFFTKMYGDSENAVQRNLVEISWLPKAFGPSSKIRVTKINGVAQKLQKISDELDNLPAQFRDFLTKPGGTFSWRPIAGTKRLSAHSFGMTIDINVARSHYWLWDYNKGREKEARSEKEIDYSQFPQYKNEIPLEIVEIFEKHHFIWGGKWFHYDTMHFEYRPELFTSHSFDPPDARKPKDEKESKERVEILFGFQKQQEAIAKAQSLAKLAGTSADENQRDLVNATAKV